MNAPLPHRAILRLHAEAIARAHPLTLLGTLPRGSAAHIFDPEALDFLAEKRPGLTLFGLAEAEIDLAERLGRPVGIVLRSGLREPEASAFARGLDPL